MTQPTLCFDGPLLEPADHIRLTGQWLNVFNLMRDGDWRTLAQISSATGHPEASVSARLRDYRKPRFGGHDVQRRRVGAGYEYRLVMRMPCDGAA